MYTLPNNDRYTYTGSETNKYEKGILDTVAMLGFMSLKDSDHTVSGINATMTKRILKDAVETRKAADRLLESGAVVLMGTWSNGIQVGPGTGFARIHHSVAPTVKAEKARRARKTSDMTSPAVDIMHGPAYVAPLAPPPGISFVDGPYTATEFWYISCDVQADLAYDAEPSIEAEITAAIEAITGEEYTQDEPTPIYTPAVGTFVHLMLTHDDGRTTERVVNVKSTLHMPAYFRGYDVRYQKTRNYQMSSVVWMREWDKNAITDMNGKEVVAKYAA